MSKRNPKAKQGKNTAFFGLSGNKRSPQKNTIHVFVVMDSDEVSSKAWKAMRNSGSAPSTPVSSRPTKEPERDHQTRSIVVPNVYDFAEVAKLLPGQINGSTYNLDNTAIVYLLNINSTPPDNIDPSFPRALAKKCRLSRFFWVTTGWNDEKASQQKNTEFELRNVLMMPTLQQGSHFMRMKPHGSMIRDIMLLVDTSLNKQEGNQRIWGMKTVNKLMELNPFSNDQGWQSTESTSIGIDDLTANDIIVAVMGPTGAGKSTFIKTISGHDVVIGHGLESCTSEVSIIRFRAPELSDVSIALVDTPGFDDTNKSDLEIFKLISEWLDKTFKKKIYLDGVLYLHRISDNRMAGTPYKNYQMFEQLCGRSSFKQVVLVTTMWGDKSEEEMYKRREDELRKRFWSHMIRNGSSIARFDKGDNKAPFDILGPIVANATTSRQALTLQNELNVIKLSLPETSAGRVMYSKLEALLERQKKILDDLRKDITAEEKENDGQVGVMQKLLEEEFRAIDKEMKTVVSDLQSMKLSVPSRLLTSLRSRFQLRFSFSKV